MALYLVIEREDGSTDRFPMLNRESRQIDAHVLSATIEQEVVTGRGNLAERRYQGTDIRPVIRALRKGDRIEVKTYPESYNDRELDVVKAGDEVTAVSAYSTDQYFLIPRFYGSQNQGDGRPWFRTADGYESRGEIEEIEVVELAGNSQ